MKFKKENKTITGNTSLQPLSCRLVCQEVKDSLVQSPAAQLLPSFLGDLEQGGLCWAYYHHPHHTSVLCQEDLNSFESQSRFCLPMASTLPINFLPQESISMSPLNPFPEMFHIYL